MPENMHDFHSVEIIHNLDTRGVIGDAQMMPETVFTRGRFDPNNPSGSDIRSRVSQKT